MMKKEELKTAAELALDAEVDVEEFIYCYKDKAVSRFTPPFINDKEPKFMVDGLKTSILKQQHTKEVVGLQLCFCGTFNLKDGSFDVFDEPQIIADCDVLIEKVGGLTDGKL